MTIALDDVIDFTKTAEIDYLFSKSESTEDVVITDYTFSSDYTNSEDGNS